MRIVFMGTPDFAVPTLTALIEGGHEVVAVVTQPDKPKGRGKAVLTGLTSARLEDLRIDQHILVSVLHIDNHDALADTHLRGSCKGKSSQ